MTVFRIRGHIFSFFHKRYYWTQGIRSECSDGKHVVFCDFDDMYLSEVIACLRIVQNMIKCGTFYIFESSKNSYHAVCLDKRKFEDLLMLQYKLGNVGYMLNAMRRKYWTLRCAPKWNKPAPKYLMSLVGEDSNDRSNAHAIWLKINYGIDCRGTDGSQEVIIDKYGAGQRKFKEEDFVENSEKQIFVKLTAGEALVK